jgi:hypothetical protein
MSRRSFQPDPCYPRYPQGDSEDSPWANREAESEGCFAAQSGPPETEESSKPPPSRKLPMSARTEAAEATGGAPGRSARQRGNPMPTPLSEASGESGALGRRKREREPSRLVLGGTRKGPPRLRLWLEPGETDGACFIGDPNPGLFRRRKASEDTRIGDREAPSGVERNPKGKPRSLRALSATRRDRPGPQGLGRNPARDGAISSGTVGAGGNASPHLLIGSIPWTPP